MRPTHQLRHGYVYIMIVIMFMVFCSATLILYGETKMFQYEVSKNLMLRSKLNEAADNAVNKLMSKARYYGPGYFTFEAEQGISGSLIRKEEQDRGITKDHIGYHYDYLSASVIPVPTGLFSQAPLTSYQSDLMLTLGIKGENCEQAREKLASYGAKDTSFDCNFKLVDNEVIQTNNRQEAPDSHVKFLYPVPALGTGNAAYEVCDPLEIQSTIPHTSTYVDPLNHPCNWGYLQLGETIAVPLFTKVEGDDGKLIVQYHNPKLLTLRLRLRCLEKTFWGCEPENRLEYELPKKMKTLVNAVLSKLSDDQKRALNPNTHPNEYGEIYRELDITPRLLDYAIVDWRKNDKNHETVVYRPLSERSVNQFILENLEKTVYTKKFIKDRGTTKDRDQNTISLNYNFPNISNYEISQFKLKFQPNKITSLNRELPKMFEYLNNYDPKTKTTYFNIAGITSFPIIFNIDDLDAPSLADRRIAHNFIQFENLSTVEGRLQPYFFYNSLAKYTDSLFSGNKQIYPFDPFTTLPDRITELEAGKEDTPELYLVFRLENYTIPARGKKENSEQEKLYKARGIEWQVISDKPLGSPFFGARGYLYHPDMAEFRDSRVESKHFKLNKLPGPTDTGIVFIN